MGKTNKDRRDKDFTWGNKEDRIERVDKKKREGGQVKGGRSYADFVEDDTEEEK
jgi:hypothetical protein